jgi:hypothetical protein
MEQAIFFKNAELNEDTKKLVACGVSNNDMLTLTKSSALLNRSGGGVNSNDQNLLNSFFSSLS